MNDKKEREQLTNTQKDSKERTAYSKKITDAVILLVYLFVIFICYEMHINHDLSPVAYIGAGMVVMLAICVKAYMKRAYQQDLVNMKINQAKELSKLRREFGDDFFYENIEDINLDGN